MKFVSTLTLSKWLYKQADHSTWKSSLENKEITEIHPDLIANGEIPDPFIDDNEKKVQWVAEKDWEYKTHFDVSDSGCKVYELIFEGLDTFADVYVNDNKILSTDNMFVQYRADVTEYLKPKDNELRLYFHSALLKGRKLQDKFGKFIASNGEMSRTHVRKAQFQYGWDWGPLLLTCGPYRPVKLISYDSYIDDVYIDSVVQNDGSVDIDVKVEVIASEDVEVQVQMFSPSGEKLKEFQLKGSGSINKLFTEREPQLWFPFTHGDPALYEFKLFLQHQDKTLQVITKKVGFRKVELVQEPLVDQEGSSFYFKVNNIPVYINGSNWIPAHSFHSSMTDQDYKDWLKLMVDGSQNMVRIWGGGYYERDIFYDECDRIGLLVWQDMMFACGQYPGYPEFIESVTKETVCQFKRLRKHCSIALLCGGNEDYEFAERHKLEWNKDDVSGDYTKTTFPARAIYEGVFPTKVKELCSEIPYHPGTPYGGSATTDKTAGDIHQWNVWHGVHEKYQNWYKLGGRFVSEFGMEGAPSRKTFDQFISDDKQKYPQSYMVDHHNKCELFERKLALYVTENIRIEDYDFNSWIYATQLMQAECLGYAYRCWRREWKGEKRRYSGGTIVWQINDCWPCTSWGIVDHYKRPKLAYYSVKRESANIGVGIYRNEARGESEWRDRALKKTAPFDYSDIIHDVDIWGVNSTTKEISVTFEMETYNVTTGDKLLNISKEVTLKPNQTTDISSKYSIPSDIPVVVHCKLVQNGIVIASSADWPQPLKYLMFPERKFHYTVEDGLIKFSTNKPIKGVEITLEKERSLEDNGFDVFPGTEKMVKVPGLSKNDHVSVRYYQQKCW